MGMAQRDVSMKNQATQPRSQSSSAISDVTSPVKLVGKIRLGSKPPLVTRIARTGLGMRLQATIYKETPVGMNCPVGGDKFYERDSL